METERPTTAIMLTHNYSDTAWFQDAAALADAICFTRGRVRFVDPDGEFASPSQARKAPGRRPPSERGNPRRRRARAKQNQTNQAVPAQEQRGRLRTMCAGCHHGRAISLAWLESATRMALGTDKSARRRRPKGAGRGGQEHRVAATLGIKVRVGDRPLSSHRLGSPSQGRNGRALQAMGDVVCTRFMAMPHKRG